MNRIKNLGATAAVALAVAWGGAAQAELITAAGPNPTFDVFASCAGGVRCGDTPSSTVSTEAIFSNFVWSNSNHTLTLTLELINTTPQGSLSVSDWNSVRLTAFGFNTIPDATSVTGNSSIFTVLTEENFPGFNTLDICGASGSGNNCSGGGGGGLLRPGLSPNTDTFQLVLNGLNGSIDLGTDVAGGAETFDFKIQSNFGSFEFAGPGVPCIPGSPGCVENPPTDVPEPGSLALFGTALVAFGGMAMFWRRRKQNGSALPTGMAA